MSFWPGKHTGFARGGGIASADHSQQPVIQAPPPPASEVVLRNDTAACLEIKPVSVSLAI